MKPQAPVHRVEVHPSDRAGDPLGASVFRSARSLGIPCTSARTSRVYLFQAAFDPASLERVRSRLLTDPILEESTLGSRPARPGDRIIEVHPLPGVMDPAAQTVRDAVRELTGIEARVITGIRYDFGGLDRSNAEVLARRLLANGVIEQVHFEPWTPTEFPMAHPADQTLRHVPIIHLGDDELASLSRKGHLFLSLQEMRAIQSHFRDRGREPTDIELETLAQTWSEHCVHKTLKSTVRYREEGATLGAAINWAGRPGVTAHPDGSVTIKNLLKSTVAAATHELIAGGLDWALSVFVDNAGVIALDEHWAINVKVETHNRPSAIEPYGGAATGVGGCIRDVIGTGLGAKPIANTDVFCVASPALTELPPGVLHPRRILSRVVDGVRDYGNRMGIPTVNGAVYFDDRYVGNPLVFCGCVGLLPRNKIKGRVNPGDRIIALGGRTGRDGIHGATFSSAELTHTHADEFAHAVQIGNAIEEKRVLDAILRARDAETGCLYSGLTDCGAGGFSSAIGEMGSKIGATVHLDRAPLKYDGLRYDEIWISESQERMILAVPAANIEALRAICKEEGVEMADLGEFGTPTREIILNFNNKEVGRLSCDFLHDGIPMPTREAIWCSPSTSSTPSRGTGLQPVSSSSSSSSSQDIRQTLLTLLAHPIIASKRWIVRQYDHEVQGNTIIKPLVGPGGIGPGDATVIQPIHGSKQGIAIACGLATPVGDPVLNGDPYLMAIAAVDECVRNLVCVGADPDRIAILDNFCWPSCDKPQNMASLVRAAVGCYDAAKAYRTPFVSGKDSLNNQFRYTDPDSGRQITIEIPPTLLISGVGIVPDVSKCVTMDLKRAGGMLYLIGDQRRSESRSESSLIEHPRTARLIARLIQDRVVRSAHDCSEGGWLVALAEMLIASSAGVSNLGASLQHGDPLHDRSRNWAAEMFAELPGRYIIEVDRTHERLVEDHPELRWTLLGLVDDSGGLRLPDDSAPASARTIPVAELRRAFLGTLDW
ncbi:MAG: phosphoribosylformylglycinamidine synthase subunit PurS [Phycisphaerae bacterium]|nr:phosphoribosylformylglycinamidine synthase subunit PurS [Phycisphaerae bacterium]